MSHTLTVSVQERRAKTRAERRTSRKHAALAISAVAITPLIAFAILWASLLLVLGGLWLLGLFGLV